MREAHVALLALGVVALAGCKISEPPLAAAPPVEEAVAHEPLLPPATGHLQVCGVLDDEKPDYTFNSAKLEDFPLDPKAHVGHLPGPYSMVLLDRDGRVLSRLEFGAMWGHGARIGTDGKIDCHPVEVPFSCVDLPFVPGGESIEVRRGDAVLERFARTLHAPEVRITAPAAGARLPAKGALKIAWEASDADGDRLWHSIYYRSGAGDGGPGLWQVVLGDFQDTSMELDASLFPPGPAPELLVLTTDRFNTARAVVQLEGPGAARAE
jgi:hypothetical protein